MNFKKDGKRFFAFGLALLVIVIFLAACTANQKAALNASEANQNYAPYPIKNFIDQRNYSWRLQVSDDPSMILWCTMFPPIPGTKPITIPIIGKLTSSGKRPFAGDSTMQVDDQGMYGSSGEYRYGFGPTGMQEYYDITAMSTFCTTQPMLWQTQLTVVVQSKDNALLTASQQAHDLIAAGKLQEAQQVLDAAIQATQGGQ